MPKARILSRRTLFRGKVFSVTTELVREPNGITARRDVIHHPGSVVILAVDHKKRALLERQFRHAAGKYLWELPAGRIDTGESALAAAKRELREETGYTARRWRRLLFYYASPGFLSETMAVYLAESLTAGRATPEADESIATRFFPIAPLVRAAAAGRLEDGKTISAVLAYAARRQRD
ncbi:MAG: NUDIX hydrolase [Candidatus Koribacter versatilis]|uniref:GDP-mannose pyrophosphatase n=1 Tax=Candidatus Korobacter versatilis TaxID=658062 RepID=A0A932ENX1_9BACT|nr:NUDIX hydrolase [Candidatus Koribacter versatilis]